MSTVSASKCQPVKAARDLIAKRLGDLDLPPDEIDITPECHPPDDNVDAYICIRRSGSYKITIAILLLSDHTLPSIATFASLDYVAMLCGTIAPTKTRDRAAFYLPFRAARPLSQLLDFVVSTAKCGLPFNAYTFRNKIICLQPTTPDVAIEGLCVLPRALTRWACSLPGIRLKHCRLPPWTECRRWRPGQRH